MKYITSILIVLLISYLYPSTGMLKTDSTYNFTIATLDRSEIDEIKKNKIRYTPPEWTNYRQDDPNISFDKRSDKHKQQVAIIEKKKQNNEIIADHNCGDRIIWGLDDNLTRVYYLMFLLEKGDVITRLEALSVLYFINSFEDQYPLIYTDLNGSDHLITKEWFIECIKSFLDINDPNLKVNSSRSLIGLGYFDDKIFSILEYYARGSNIESWQPQSSLRYRCEFNNKVKNDKNFDLDANPNFENTIINKCKDDLRNYSIEGLISIKNHLYEKEIKDLLTNLLDEDISERAKNSIKNYLEQK